MTIQGVAAGSIAEERGLVAGDGIIALNDEPIGSMSREAFTRHMTTSPLVVQIVRQGSPLQVELAFDPSP